MSSWWQSNVVKPIHGMRIPLGPRGRNVMGGVYFSLPLVAGYFLYQWTEKQAALNGMRGTRPEALARSSRAANQLKTSNRELNELLAKVDDRSSPTR